jgi:hypothetical protein
MPINGNFFQNGSGGGPPGNFRRPDRGTVHGDMPSQYGWATIWRIALSDDINTGYPNLGRATMTHLVVAIYEPLIAENQWLDEGNVEPEMQSSLTHHWTPG